MRNIRIALWGIPLALLALWLLADPMGLIPQPFTYFGFRGGAVQLSGILAIGAMTACMVLATRARVLEALFGGLDKMYRLHKWMGILALVTGTAHWWLAKGTKWMARWGWLERPARKPGSGSVPAPEGLEAWLRGQRHLVETVGEWVFYIAAIMLILALIKRFPYKIFAKTHKWIAIGYLLLVWHAFVLFKFQYWAQPIGWVMAAMLILGTISALWTLFGRTGASRTVGASVSDVKRSEPLRTTFFTLAVPKGWPGHEAGQFAFVRAGEGDEPHPYTIASAWDEKKRELHFAVRALGDYTGRLHETLKQGMDVRVEGPYGCFNFEDGTLRQIWVGGGIGITPFLARLQQLAAKGGDGRSIDLFHSTREEDPEFLARLQQMCDAAGVRLHVLIDGKDGFLNVERLLAAVPEWRQAGVWFCGPAGFGARLQKDLLANGMIAGRWHQELFDMR